MGRSTPSIATMAPLLPRRPWARPRASPRQPLPVVMFMWAPWQASTRSPFREALFLDVIIPERQLVYEKVVGADLSRPSPIYRPLRACLVDYPQLFQTPND